jgi:hypothetical protein
VLPARVYACRSGREQHKCGFLGFRDIKLASGCPRFSMGQFHNRYIEAIDGRGAIRQKGDRFRKLNDIANLASGQVLIKACSSRSNFPSCQQIGEESRGATMDNSDDRAAADPFGRENRGSSIDFLAEAEGIPATAEFNISDPTKSERGKDLNRRINHYE